MKLFKKHTRKSLQSAALLAGTAALLVLIALALSSNRSTTIVDILTLRGIAPNTQTAGYVGVNVTASPSSIDSGNGSTISWTTWGADWCQIIGYGIVPNGTFAFWWPVHYVPVNGSHYTGALPTGDHSFTVACANNGPWNSGVGSSYATVHVAAPPPPPPCTPDTWSCTGWGTCSSGGSQTRTCSHTSGTCNTANPNPTSQSCTPPTVPPTVTTSGGTGSGGASILQGGTATFAWTCTPPATHSLGNGLNTGGAMTGSVPLSPTTTTNYSVTCVGPAGNSVPTTRTITVLPPQLNILASPDRVQRGAHTTITWTAANVTTGSCTVTSNGGTPTWTTSPQSPVINNQTVFTLRCSTPAGVVQALPAIVNIIPSFEEI